LTAVAPVADVPTVCAITVLLPKPQTAIVRLAAAAVSTARIDLL
jgi:hypothetical protein